MGDLENELKEEIKKRYGSIKKFAEATEIPYTTLASILKRGVANTSASNILKIAEALNLGISYNDDGSIEFFKFVRPQKKYIANKSNVSTDFYRDDYQGERTKEQKELYFVNKMGGFYEELNDKGQDKAIEQVELLTKIPEYRKDSE